MSGYRPYKRYWLGLGVLLMTLGWGCDRTAHYLSLHAPEPDAQWLIVEGWLPESVLPAVAAEYERGSYTRVLVVGGLHDERISQMGHNGQLTFALPRARTVHRLTVEAYGTSGKGEFAHFEVWVNDTLRVGEAYTSRRMRAYHFMLDSLVIGKVAVHYTNNHHPTGAGEDRNLLVRSLALDGNVVPALGSGAVYEYYFYDEFRREPQLATLAELTALRLGYLKIPEAALIALPVRDVSIFRTYTAASRVRQWLDSAGIAQPANLCSMGLHARRSGWLYQRTWPKESRLGIINVQPLPSRWWTAPHWVKALLRETAAWIATNVYFFLVEIARWPPTIECILARNGLRAPTNDAAAQSGLPLDPFDGMLRGVVANK